MDFFMKSNIVSFFVGLIFALGLGIAHLTQPQKIQHFLDIFGQWDYSLIFVMATAIVLHSTTYFLVKKRPTPLWNTKWDIPKQGAITKPLVVGAFLFGIGWGLGGYCPGPALVALASFKLQPFLFCVSMASGMWIYTKFLAKRFM